MVRISLAVVMVASLATAAHAQGRGMGGHCGHGGNRYGFAGSMSSMGMRMPGNAVNAARFGPNAASFYGYGMGAGFNPMMAGRGFGPQMAMPYGMNAGFGWGNPYATAGYGFGANRGMMNRMNRGPNAFRGNRVAARPNARGFRSIEATPRYRSNSTKARLARIKARAEARARQSSSQTAEVASRSTAND